MMYSNQDILAAIESGELEISPLKPEMVKAAGLTLHLGPVLLKPDSTTVVDVKNGVLPEYETIELEEDKPYRIEPGEFLLAHTLEECTVGSSIGFFIEGRSTLARIGLTVVQTAMLVYPGHAKRTVTLELANHGPNPILLYPKMKIARVALFELKTPSTIKYDVAGKYREQKLVGPPIFKNELQ